MNELTVDQMCSLVWWFATRNMETEAEKAEFKAQMWRPESMDAEIPAESPWSAENEMKAFSALAFETGQA